MIGSISVTEAMSLLIGKRLSIEAAIVGCISGVSMVGVIAGADVTFSTYFIAGAFAGAICGFWL